MKLSVSRTIMCLAQMKAKAKCMTLQAQTGGSELSF
jgi:hypothetical protein